MFARTLKCMLRMAMSGYELRDPLLAVLNPDKTQRPSGLVDDMRFHPLPSHPMPDLPLEICEHIIDIVATEALASEYWNLSADPWWSTLVACAYTCRAWYTRSRFYLCYGTVTLRKRQDVVSLHTALRADSRLRKTVKHVTIVGGADALMSPPAHLGTFALMLAGRLPNFTNLHVHNIMWRVGSIHAQCIQGLATFQSLAHLHLQHVVFISISQFTCLISAISRLRVLQCCYVDCRRTTGGAPAAALVPFNKQSIRCLNVFMTRSPTILEFLIALAETAKAEALILTQAPSLVSSGAARCQELLDASAGSLRRLLLALYFGDMEPRMLSGMKNHVNLAGNTRLQHLILECQTSPADDYSWIPLILSSVTSDVMETLEISFVVSGDDTLLQLTALLRNLKQYDSLTQVDKILSNNKFADANTKLWFIKMVIHVSHQAFGDHQLWSELGGNEWARWDQLVQQKMPRLAKRDILRTLIRPL